jgi:hypothetical protein
MVRLKIGEAFPVGWGEAHGCAERARLHGRFIAPDPKARQSSRSDDLAARVATSHARSPVMW